MPCPVCTHTLQNLGLDGPGRRVFWCPRCGTLKMERPEIVETESPSLVVRVSHLLNVIEMPPAPDMDAVYKALADIRETLGRGSL